MTKEYYREIVALKALSINNVQEELGKVVQVTLHLDSSISGEHNLILIKPRLTSDFSDGWSELNEKLGVEQFNVVKVHGQALEFGQPDRGLSWRLEICRNDGTIDTILCNEIQGLPD